MLSVTPPNTSVRSVVWDYGEVLTAITLITIAGRFSPLNYHALGYVYLFAVIALSLRIRRWPALMAAILSSAAWDFFFIPPTLSFRGIHIDEGLLLTTYFAVALIGSQLTALRSAADRADLVSESEHMRQTLLDTVSHEIMTPMAVFRSAIEQLGTSDAARRELVIIELKIAMQRLDRLVANLLEHNRLESGVLRPNLDWCDGHELVVAARRALGSRIADHPMAIEIPPDLPIFRADAVLMEQVLTQLLSNAAMHTPPGSRIRVGAGMSEDYKRVSISLDDDGPGIPVEIRETIFNKFTRGPNARPGGLGLGLSIVKGFMRAQGGDVSLDPRESSGTRFTLSLPYMKPEEDPA